MKRMLIGYGMMTLLAAGWLLPSVVLASDTRPTDSPQTRGEIKDVALRDGGVLQGQAIDHQRRPLAGLQVLIRQRDQPVAAVVTDAQGRFAVRGLRAGMYTMETTRGSGNYRLWAPRTAPPSAEFAALLVTADQARIVRAQGMNLSPLVQGAIYGGLLTGGAYWALDYNPSGS